MAFEEEYLDVLQNIEAAIMDVFRRRPDLIDFDVDEALDALIAHYKAERQGRAPRPPRLTERPEQVYEAVKTMCDWRLGREELLSASGRPFEAGLEPKTHEEIIACLKRIKKSVQRWTKQGGRQGYLRFISDFIP